MSQLLINEYLNDLATLKRVSGAQRESVIREAFKDLLKKWGKSQNLVFIPEHEFITTAKVRNYVDGALMHDLRVPFGYWEAKDDKDDLDAEIEKKFRRGYPDTNIIFEDSRRARWCPPRAPKASSAASGCLSGLLRATLGILTGLPKAR